jgi:hypothetical protein
MMKQLFAAAVAAVALPTGLLAQSLTCDTTFSCDGSGVCSPLTSQLQVSVSGQTAVLSWDDGPDFVGSVILDERPLTIIDTNDVGSKFTIFIGEALTGSYTSVLDYSDNFLLSFVGLKCVKS